VLSFVMSEALRDLRRAGRVAVAAIVLTGLALGATGAFWLLGSNLGRAVADWRDRVRILVYLKREPPAAEVNALLERVQALPQVADARYVSKAEALAALKRLLGKDAAVADSLPTNPLPASIEVTPTVGGATPAGALALIMRLEALPEVDEVAGGVEWVERLSYWRRFLAAVGLGVGAMLVLAAILTVTTATTLVLHARRQEMEIMRLVGAPEVAIRLPLLLQGMIQGLLGAGLALGALRAGHHVLAPWLEPLMTLTIGLPRLEFLSPPGMLVLLAAGAGLGGLGGALAKGRRGAA
jgi:cell division transport system permease protein